MGRIMGIKLVTRVAGCLFGVAGYVCFTMSAWSAGLDKHGDGMSDVWQKNYDILSTEIMEDPDGDGETNLEEARAGTNPRDGSSHSQVSYQPWDGSGPLMLEWEGIDLKRYSVQASDSAGTSNWNDVSSTMGGTGSSLTHPHNLSNDGGFLRIRHLDDLDDDSDKLYNWEESLLGSNPGDADTDNDGMEDGDEVLGGSDVQDPDTDDDGLDDGEDDDPLVHELFPGHPVMSTDLGISDSGWSFNSGSDAPEGAYITVLGDGVTSRSATINLGITLVPGTYKVFAKAIDYGKHSQIDFSLGGGTASVVTDDRDSNRYWTDGVSINVTSPTDTITLTIVKLKEPDETVRLLLRGLLISPDQDVTVQTEDVAVKLTIPDPEDYDNSPPIKGNLIENSSFEVGVGHGWGFSSGDWPETRRNFTVRDAHDSTVSYHGDSSMKLRLSGQAGAITLISKPYRFKSNKEYTISAYVRSSEGNPEVTFGFYSTYVPPGGFPLLNEDDFTTTDRASTNWVRVSMKARMLEYPTSDYQLKFRSYGPGFLWIDAIQVEEGDISPYAPKNHIEVGIDTEAPSHIFHEGDTLEMLLHTYRTGFETVHGIKKGYASGDLTFLADWWNGGPDDGEFTVDGTSFTPLIPPVDIPSINLGIAVDDFITGSGYILYSEENVHTRFAADPTSADNSDHFVVVRYTDQWEYNNNVDWIPFAPEPTDLLLATADFDADTVASLEGTTGDVHGIESGYASGDLTFLADWWDGGPNDGEFTVNGTQFQRTIVPIDVTPIKRGIGVDDSASGTGYILYSEEPVRDRIISNKPLFNNSHHFLAVQHDGTKWTYFNDSGSFDFSPRPSDILIAAVDFSNDTITGLLPDAPKGSTVGYEIYDHLNRVMASGTTTVSDAIGGSTETIALPSKRGFMRAYAWVVDEDGTEDELTLCLIPPPHQTGEIIHAVNAGGARYVARDGTVFEADTFFTGGGTEETTSAITNTMDDVLYQSERNGGFSYAFPVDNGTYFVKLYLAEITFNASGQRQFDVLIEGSEVISNLDLYAEVGADDKAYTVEFQTTVSDGVLNVTVNADIDEAKIGAIKITTLGDHLNPFNALLGCHAHHTDFQLEALERLGFRWNRGSSPISWFRWSATEAPEGVFTWRDDWVERAKNYGIKMVGTLGDGVPAWAQRTYFELTNVSGSGFEVGETVTGPTGSGEVTVVLTAADYTGDALQVIDAGSFSSGDNIVGSVSGTTATIDSTPRTETPALDKWETFIETVVSHYDGEIFHWEIYNEPDKEVNTIPNDEFYTELMERAAEKVHGVGEQHRVVGVGGVGKFDWIEATIQNLGPAWETVMDAASAHVYPGNAGRAKGIHTRVIAPYGLPIWNTESARFCLGSFSGVNANFQVPGEAFFGPIDSDRFYDGLIEDPGKVARNFISTIGYGFTKLFYYDGRLRGTQDNFATEPTVFEFNDSIKMKGVTLSILAHLFDYSAGLEEIIFSDTDVKGFLFQRGETALAGVYSESVSTPKLIDLSGDLSPSDVKVYEYMGNEISLGTVVINASQSPTYIEGQGLTVDELRTALMNATVSDGVDNTPPNLVITVAPRGPTSDANPRLRWIAMDEISRPTAAEPRAIEFRYQLVGVDDDWIDWSATTYREYNNVAVGNYDFQVQARDEAGNLSPIITRNIMIVPEEGL